MKKNLKYIALLFFMAACNLNVKVTKQYEFYYEEETYQTFLKGLDAYKKHENKLADSLLTIVINNSTDKLSISMPTELNPYYYRGHNSIFLEKYEQVISDFAHVKNDSTNIENLLDCIEAFKMLQRYDTAISLCNKLLVMKCDSSLILTERGVCYYQLGEMDKACADLRLAKKLTKEDVPFIDKFLKDCK